MLLGLSVLAGGLGAMLIVLVARWIDALLWRRQLVAYRLELPRKLTQDQVSGWLAAVGASTRHIPIVIEIVATDRGIAHFMVVPQLHARMLLTQARNMLPGLRTVFAPGYLADETTIRAAGELRVTSTSHPLGQDQAANAAGALLSALQPLGRGQMIRLSWLLAGTTIPHPAGLMKLAPDLARFRRLKQRSPLLRVCTRVAVSGAPPRIARSLLYRVYSVMRVLDAPGAALVRRTLPWRVVAARVRDRSIPLIVWPAILNTRELAGLLGFPIDNVQAPGLSLNASRQLPPAPEMARDSPVLAYSNFPGMEDRPLGLRKADRLRHLWLLGPTGTGKSTRLADLAVQSADEGDGFLVVDPKSDLCEEILARLPQQRLNDVVVLNPAATAWPIGLNVLQPARDEAARELVVDNVVRIFGEIWKASFGPRTTDVLRNALLTLTATKAPDGSAFTLVEVAPLLENPRFRHFVTAQRTVPESVRAFWQSYEAMSTPQQAQLVGPSLNKLRALTTRTSLRLMLGQSSGIDLGDVFTKRRIVLVSLNKGVIGSEGAALLGSFVVALLWRAALKRAVVPAASRRPAWAFLDEFQDVLRLSDDLPDALSQARALGLGYVLSHQYLGQLPPAMQAAVLGTVRSWMIFQPDYDDAHTLERRFQPDLTADDLMNLRAHEVALRLCVNGQVYPAVTGRTLPLGEPTQDAFALIKASRQRFGTNRAEVEAALLARVETTHGSTRIGRRHEGLA